MLPVMLFPTSHNNIQCCLNTNYRGDGDKVVGGGCLIVD